MKTPSRSSQSPSRPQLFTRGLHVFCSALLGLCAAASATQVTFSEVMYHPQDQPPPLAPKPEFIEVQNLSVTALDMARWQFTDGITFTFPDFNAGSNQAHFLKANERILISSADDATTRAAYPGIPAAVRIFGPWAGALDNNGETITLADKNGVIVATLTYGDSGKWPVQADGAGHSLVLADLNRAPDDWRVWRASTNRNGSPGVADPAVPAAGLALNEFHFAANAHVDWVEVRNNSRTTVVTGGTMFVASKDDFSDKVSIAGSVAAGAVASINVDFASDNDGDITLYLLDGSDNVRDAVTIRRKIGRDSWQLFPAGSREWYSATTDPTDPTDTRDVQNNPKRNTDIVINEIMADPPSNQRDAEFIELYNRGPAAVNIGGWVLDDAVNFTFPAGTTIPSGGYLVVGANASHLNASYGGLSALGNWSGSLRNGGDRIRLEDADGNLANQVDYRFGGEWPQLANGDGSSLELVHPSADNSLGSAWADSDESAKSAFTSFTLNLGTYQDRTQGGTNDDELLMWLVGDGHLILKNIVLRQTSGSTNVLANAGVTTLNNENVSGWQARGTHWQSFSDAEGVHIVADGHGDNKCNHIEKAASVAPGLAFGQSYTLTFDARWVYGKPRLVTQSWDLSIGGTTRVPIPLNLGTPGAQNSRLTAAPAPQVTAISHTPSVPAPNSTVTVTARVASADSLTGVTLFHRLDNIATAPTAGAWNSLAMNDAGTGGDASAGDGIYSAQIPLASVGGYNNLAAIVQFYVRATATNGLSTDLPKGGASTPALWICDNQNPVTTPPLRRMRIVISAYWGDALSQETGTGGHTSRFNYKFPKLSNHYFPCTFILNDSEVFHGSIVRKTGSPFTRSTANGLDRGRVVLPGDRDFRDKGRLYWDNDSGTSMLHNRIVRYWLYLFGVPGNENEVCLVTKNRDTLYTVRETNEAFDKDMLDRIWPDGSDGRFFEMDDAFWIADDGTTRLANSDGSFDYKVGDSQGAENPTAYHNNFTPKSREVDYDYSSLIAWFKQIEQNGAITPEQMERMVDVRAMAVYAAVRGYIADWDNITMNRGKNGYFYQRSTDQRFMFLHWDSDLGFDSNRIDEPIIGSLPNIGTFYTKPHVRRYLNFYLNQLLTTYAANGPRIGAWLAAEEASSTAYSVNSIYSNWPNTVGGGGVTRPIRIQQFIGTTSLSATFVLNTPAEGATVATNTVDVTGKAPLSAFSVICVGHPEAVFTWTGNPADVTPWRLAGIQLASGANVLTFRAFAENGLQIGSDLTRTINRTGDAPPVVNLLSDPVSQNVALGEVATLDASSSYDPEGAGALSYAWSVSPATGFSTNILTPAKRQLIFGVPGSYDVTLQVTDANSQVSSVTRTLSVFNSSDRDDFSGDILTGYAFQNIELLDNYSPDAWYSLNEVSGSLVIQITDRIAKPLNAGPPTFPLITRFLPAATDFSLQTNLTFVNPQIASFVTGLYLETVEGGVTTRYAFGLDGGTFLRASSSSGGAPYSATGGNGGAVAYTGGDVVLRVLRSGTNLAFQRRVNGAWTNVYTKTLPAGSTVSSGGLFAATNSPQAQRVGFDYLILSDPGNSTDLVTNLRVTEIMYQPASGGAEYIELQNVGAAPINLNGAYFEDGSPWSSQFTFGNLTLQPSQFCIVTNNVSAFQAYPNIVVAGPTSGSLNNDGEHITLKDAQGNIILDFDYSPLAPWPPAVSGKSIEVRSLTSGNYGNGANWRLGVEAGGSPGYLGLATDSDSDGTPDSVELAFGTDPYAGADQPIPIITRNAITGAVTITWRSQPSRTYTVQYRDKLEDAWQSFAPVIATGGTTSIMDSPSINEPSRFYRVSTTVP